MNIENLYKNYFIDIYRFVLSLTKDRALTEDIVQETFIRAYLNLDNSKKPPNKTWLITVSKNLYIDYLRKNKNQVIVDYDFQSVPDTTMTIVDLILKKENNKKIQYALNEMKSNYREAIVYYYFKELNYKECAKRMNVTESNFKSILFRAKRALRKILEKE